MRVIAFRILATALPYHWSRATCTEKKARSWGKFGCEHSSINTAYIYWPQQNPPDRAFRPNILTKFPVKPSDASFGRRGYELRLFNCVIFSNADRSKAWTVFTRSNAGIVGSNPTQGMDVCVCVYSVFVLSCVQVAAFRRADHSSKETYRLCKKDYETEEEARAKQRAVEPLMNEWIKEWMKFQ
jgi:hypothetical protein